MPDLFSDPKNAVDSRALEIWRARESEFPIRCRRMAPDDLDGASGAWTLCQIQAARELGLLPAATAV